MSTESIDTDRVLAVATDAAREAGEVLMAHLGRLDPARIARKSAARDLVTEADVASERLLVDRLRAEFPGHAIEAEEEVHDAAIDDRPRWFLDPLDGTVNFVHRLPCFAVSMGLWQGGTPLAAVVHAPFLRETFTAVRGSGAFLNDVRLGVSSTAELSEAILATGFPYRRGELEHSNLENFGRFFYDVRGLRRMGSAAIDLAYVAAGRLDGYWELHLSPHDVAAGGLLVLEAGGLVTDADGGGDWLRGGHIVAAGAGLHAAIRGRLVH
ncbi:MAG: inositol monophosphatase [bacterium]|nr:inositol monophosphatase [bacterium]